MLNKLQNKPLFTALLVIGIYALTFIVPALFLGIDAKSKGMESIAFVIGQWERQLATVLIVALIITKLGWWKEVGFVSVHKGGMKFILFPFLYTLILLLFSLDQYSSDKSWLMGFSDPTQLISLALVILGVGVTEELLFRGILFHGLETYFKPLIVVLLSALIFGLFHYVNLLTNAPLYQTDYQVAHAMAVGFMYGMLRLRVGALWPIMLFHAFWDFTIIASSQLTPAVTSSVTDTFALSTLLTMIIPATLYGLFVYWRWVVWKKSTYLELKPHMRTIL